MATMLIASVLGSPRRCRLTTLDPIDLAAWTVVGNVILNLDEMLMKR